MGFKDRSTRRDNGVGANMERPVVTNGDFYYWEFPLRRCGVAVW